MKEFFRKIINLFDYDIVKINIHSDAKANKIRNVRVGKFSILMPGNNPQVSSYKYFPELNSQLARLAAIVQKKYSDAALIDVGANVGDTIAVVKSQLDIPVFAIEGDAASFDFLKKNTTQFSKVTIVQTFLGEKKEEKNISFDKKGWNATLLPSENGDEVVSFKTLDSVVEESAEKKHAYKLLKVDVEGFDTIVLRGAIETIKKYNPVLFFEFNRENMDAIQEDGLQTLFSMENFGYKSVLFFDAKGRFMTRLPLSDKEAIKQLHFYANGSKSMIPYYDLCLFHKEDGDIENEFLNQEFRLN